MASPALFSNLVLASRRKRRIAPLPVSSRRSFSPSLRSEPSTEATVVRTSSPLSALDFLGGRWIWGTGIPPGRRLSGYVLGYWFGYWFGGYCPGGYCPGGYWLGGYCPVGYWPPVGYWAEAGTAHRSIAATATTAKRKGRRIVNMPPGSILYAFGPGGRKTWDCHEFPAGVAGNSLAVPGFAAAVHASPLNVALHAVAFSLEGGPAGMVAGAARGLGGLGRLVHGRFPIQRRLGILRKIRRMAGLAFVLGALGVRRVVVRDIAVLGIEHEFGGRFLILGHHGRQRDHGQKQKTG